MANSLIRTIICCVVFTGFSIIDFSCKENVEYDENRNFKNDPTIESRAFVRTQGYVNLGQIALAELALSRTNHDSVKILSQLIINEHTKAQKDLIKTAKSERMTLPDTINFRYKQLKERLSKLNGFSFDTVYINSQVKLHQKILKDLQNEIKYGNDKENLIYARKYFPYYQTHFNKINRLKTSLQKEYK